MGRIGYSTRDFEVPDRTLAHLQVVILDKLRRSETFSLTLGSGLDGGTRTVVIGPGTELAFVYSGNRPPRLNRRWLAQLAGVATTNPGLLVTSEPDDGEPLPE